MVLKNPARDKRNFINTLKTARIGLRESQYEVGLMYAHGMGVSQDLEQAVIWIQKAAERGLAAAQYLLATRYATGAGVEHDEKKALWWLMHASEQGHAKALYKLGKTFSLPHQGLANRCLEEAAEQGLAEAQLALGNECALGKGHSQDYGQALHWYGLAAEQDHAPAQCALAGLYAKGLGVEKNEEEAQYWYRKAVQQNSPAAQVALEFLDVAGVGRSKGKSRARRKPIVVERRKEIERWEKVIESGDADARYHLGLMFEQGIGVEKSAEQAQELYAMAARQDDPRAQVALAKIIESQQDASGLFWFQKAATQGYAPAQCELGRRYLRGQGVDRDLYASMSWLFKAAENADEQALLLIGSLASVDLEQMAVACFRRLAERGDAHGQFMLGQHYAQGLGIEKSMHAAVYWWQESAVQGHAPAQCALGGACLSGKAIARDFKKAFFWFQKAAEQNDAKAQWNLGSMFAKGGDGVPQDLRQAFDWCQRAADSEFAPAQATLAALFLRIDKVDDAVHWWTKAAQQGDSEALYNLAIMRSTGKGGAKDHSAAFQLFCQAAEQGLVNAQSRLGVLYATGEGVAMDAIEAHKWFIIAANAGDEGARENVQKSEALLGTMQILEAKRRAKLAQ